MWSLVRPVLICDVRNFREENKVKLQTKLSDFLLICLPSEARLSQVNFVLLFLLFLWRLKLLGCIFSSGMQLSVKKANFWCTRRTRNVLSICKKKNSVDWLNFKTKVQIIFQNKFCVLCPWSGQTSQIVIEKGKPV